MRTLPESLAFASLADGTVEAHEPLSGKTWRLDADTAIRVVLQQPAAEEASRTLREAEELVDESLKDEWRFWSANGWRWSAPLFLAARRAQFADMGREDWRARQSAVLDTYVHAAPIPVERPVSGASIALPAPADAADQSVGTILQKRRSVPNPPPRAVEAEVLAGILNRALRRVARIRARSAEETRADPLVSYGSALDFYIAIYNVVGVDPGIYRIALPSLNLTRVVAGDCRMRMSEAMIGQDGPVRGAFTFTIVGEFERYAWRYRHERALPLLWMDAARVASEVIWELTDAGMQMQISPAALDSAMLANLGLPDDGTLQNLYNISAS